MTTDTDFDKATAELAEAQLLLGEGKYFDVPKRSLLRHVGGSSRRFAFKPPVTGTMIHFAKECLLMRQEAELLIDQPLDRYVLDAYKRNMVNNGHRAARIIAIMVLISDWKIKLFGGLLTRYLLSHLSPGDMKLLSERVLSMNLGGLSDFGVCTALLAVMERPTQPTAVQTVASPPSTDK